MAYGSPVPAKRKTAAESDAELAFEEAVEKLETMFLEVESIDAMSWEFDAAVPHD